MVVFRHASRGVTGSEFVAMISNRNDLKPYRLRNSEFILPRYNTVKYGRYYYTLGPNVMIQVVQLWEKCTTSERLQTNDKMSRSLCIAQQWL